MAKRQYHPSTIPVWKREIHMIGGNCIRCRKRIKKGDLYLWLPSGWINGHSGGRCYKCGQDLEFQRNIRYK